METRRFIISLTTMAAKCLGAMAEENQAPKEAGLRLGVTTDGCEGSKTKFRYQMALEAKPPTANDEEFESEGIRIYVDRASLPHLDGLQLDVRQEPTGATFVFLNPKAQHSCGCGHTFSEVDHGK